MNVSSDELQALLHLDLYEAGWHDRGNYPGMPPQQFAMSAISHSLFKKFTNEKQDDTCDSAALALFLECNARCSQYNYETSIATATLYEEIAMNEAKNFLFDLFLGNDLFKESEPTLLNWPGIVSRFSLGNGSNIGSKSTDFYTKYVNSTMAHTDPLLYQMYVQATSSWKIWADVEAFRSNCFPTEVVRGSRLSFVPKTRLISRTICTEPVLNMLFQKGIGALIEERVRRVSGIDLSLQPARNAELARIGSVTGEFATIDLSSASDTISISLLEKIIPPQPLAWLKRCRSPRTILPDGSEVELHMISSMGNGFTFPLQTAIFLAIVQGAYRVLDIKIQRPRGTSVLGNYGVFGDDIVVDKRAFKLVCRLLEICGFTVNLDKSFSEGPFRESCGHDYYSGHNVRGVYLKKLLTSNDIYSAINRLNRWSSEHGILLRRCIHRLRKCCRFIGVPFDEADDVGIKVPLSLFRSARRDRNGAIFYLASVRVPLLADLSNVSDDEIKTSHEYTKLRRLLPSFRYNPDGLLYCLLAGWIRDGSLGLRSSRPKTVLRRRRTPGWETAHAAHGVSHEYYERWKMFVEANLVS